MSCPNPLCNDGLIQNPFHDDPEALLICPTEDPGSLDRYLDAESTLPIPDLQERYDAYMQASGQQAN